MDNLAQGATIRIGLQQAVTCVKYFCKEWGLKINVDKTETEVFKKGGKLSSNEKWWLGGEKTDGKRNKVPRHGARQ